MRAITKLASVERRHKGVKRKGEEAKLPERGWGSVHGKVNKRVKSRPKKDLESTDGTGMQWAPLL